jgi:hypothetical protein
MPKTSLVTVPSLTKKINTYVEQECGSQSTIAFYCTWNEVQNNGWPNLMWHYTKGIHDFSYLYMGYTFHHRKYGPAHVQYSGNPQFYVNKLLKKKIMVSYANRFGY